MPQEAAGSRIGLPHWRGSCSREERDKEQRKRPIPGSKEEDEGRKADDEGLGWSSETRLTEVRG